MLDWTLIEIVLLMILGTTSICALLEFEAWRRDDFRIFERRGGRWR